MDWLEIIRQLIQGNVGATDPRAPQTPQPMMMQQGMMPQQGMGGGSLRDRMLLEQRAKQLSTPGGMGY